MPDPLKLIRFGEYLVEKKVLDDRQLLDVLAEHWASGRRVGETIAARGYLATEEVERFTFRGPGQATSYFYGYTRLMELRADVEKALGPRFDEERFHDFVLAQGLLPPDLLRKAVMDGFVHATPAAAATKD